MPIFCIFGDSTAWGAWDLEKGGWVNRLWLWLAEQAEHDVYNLSISGGTTKTILARFEHEATIREADVLIFQTGGNDSAYEHTEENHLVMPDAFKTNLEEIISRGKKICSNLIFIGFKNCDESKTMPVPWRDIYYTNKNIQRYNDIMRETCERHGVLFLELFGTLNNEDFTDGLHPNAAGHEKIFQRIKNFLEANRLI